MADFQPALAGLLASEGGYSNHPQDRGGETWRGISRAHFPDWPGWRLIDSARRARGFPGNLEKHRRLHQAVEDFYRQHFWRRIAGDRLTNQQVVEELFDTAVNMGVRRAVRFLQEALNLLNRNQRNYPDLVVDGRLGPRTRAAMAQLLENEAEAVSLLRLMNILQGGHYLSIMRNDPSQEVFVRGWLSRVQWPRLPGT